MGLKRDAQAFQRSLDLPICAEVADWCEFRKRSMRNRMTRGIPKLDEKTVRWLGRVEGGGDEAEKAESRASTTASD